MKQKDFGSKGPQSHVVGDEIDRRRSTGNGENTWCSDIATLLQVR